jgi:hypothetical protein
MDVRNQPFLYDFEDTGDDLDDVNVDYLQRYRYRSVVPSPPYEIRIPAWCQNSHLPEVYYMCPDTGEETRMTIQEIPEGVTAARPLGNAQSLRYTLGCQCHSLVLNNTNPSTNGFREKLYSWGYQILNIILDFLQI